MAEHFVTPSAGIDLDATSTTKEFALGAIVTGTDSSGSYAAEYKYVKASAAIAQYAVVKIDDDGTAAELDTTTSGVEPTAVGVAQVAFAQDEYGWVVVSGNGTVQAISGGSAAADVAIYTTTTAGHVDDVSSNSDKILGLKLTSAESGGVATFYAATRMTTN
jgi:hypothetical protein